MKPTKDLKAVIKPRIIAILDAILILLVIGVGERFLSLFGLEPKDQTSAILMLLLLLLIVISWLSFYIYKFHVVEKELLQIEPNFYQQQEYSRWFEYYATKLDNDETP